MKKSVIRATGLKPPVTHAPKRLATTADVIKLQRLMVHALVRPLTASDGMQETWIDGRPMAEVAEEYIKSNDRLTSFERLQLYNRMYWFRLIDCVYDDSPGLRAVIGEKKFPAFVEAYLAKYPSRSFTLRNLCERLGQFVAEEPQWSAPHTKLAQQVAAFERAQTEAFDGESRPVLTTKEIAKTPPDRLRLSLQPYLTLLALDYPIDDYVIAVKRRDALRGEASHAVDQGSKRAANKKVRRPRRQRTYLVVHRYQNQLYYKRVDGRAFKILSALHAGETLADAVTAAGRGTKAEDVREWFGMWMSLGWLCRRK
jgi:hypothetical protein